MLLCVRISCLLSVVSCVKFVVCFCRLLSFVYCSVFATSCLLCVVGCCLLFVICCSLVAVCWLLFVACALFKTFLLRVNRCLC